MFKGAFYYFTRLRNNQWKNIEDIEEIKWKKLKENIRYAYEHVPYYRDKFERATLSNGNIYKREDLLSLPITTKRDILESKKRYISDEFSVDKLHVSKTSGSTGEPFLSYFDDRSWNILKLASKYRARAAAGFFIGERFVVIEAMPIKDAREYNFSLSFSKIFLNKRFLSVYESLEEHVKFYKKFRPKTLYGFPSYFMNLVSYLEKNSIKLDSIERIFTSSEVLCDSMRKVIENHFGFRIYDIYGSTEMKEVSWECPAHEGYHINEDLVYVECIKEDGIPAKPGEVGEIVMSSLENKAMPLIRYSIGDMGKILDKRCSCGRSFMMMVPTYGRMVDYFVLEGGREISPYDLTMSVEEIEGVVQYQILQKSNSLVEIYVKTNDSFAPTSEEKIIHNLKKVLGEGVEVNFNLVDYFDNRPGRKFRVVRSELKDGN